MSVVDLKLYFIYPMVWAQLTVNSEANIPNPGIACNKYSGKPLIWSPMGHKNLAVLTGWPY